MVSSLSKRKWFPWLALGIFLSLIPLAGQSNLVGGRVWFFLTCFCAACLVYSVALIRLQSEAPSLFWIWVGAIAFRLVMLSTPVSLSNDVYRYIWEGHLVNLGINPYALPVSSPTLDFVSTELRERVDYAWMASPYLPVAQIFFGMVEWISPQNPFAFQLSAVLLDLGAGGLIQATLKKLEIPEKAVLLYVWNPLVVVEFAHGAHVDALMVFFMCLSVWGLVFSTSGGRTLSAVAAAAAVLVKGLPLLCAPLFLRRWGLGRTALFAVLIWLPLAGFAREAGWGLGSGGEGAFSPTGVFGAIRVYASQWEFNGGIYHWLAKLGSPAPARIISFGLPLAMVCLLGWLEFRQHIEYDRQSKAGGLRRIVRWSALPIGLYLLLTATVHPWYLTSVLALLPFYWGTPEEPGVLRRWIVPWVYFMVFEGFTYLSYTGLSAPAYLEWAQLAGYFPFWGLLVWAGSSGGWKALGFFGKR